MREILQAFFLSLQRFEEILSLNKNIMIRDASIQRFEFTVELAWKSIQKFLKAQQISCRSPKEYLQKGFEFGLIEDDPLWIDMMEDRNLTSHTYQEATAEKVYERLPNYLNKLKDLKNALVKELEKTS